MKLKGSAIWISMIIIFVVEPWEVASVKKCDENGFCKYGGRCGPQNTCVCNFNCSPLSWKMEFYCGPKTKNGHQYFYNLCQILTHACEQQEDIPIIKIDFTKPPGEECNDQAKPIHRLCPKAQDFMGRCGGTGGITGSIEAGICLKETNTGSTFCQCPKEKGGISCEAKVFELFNPLNTDEKEPKCENEKEEISSAQFIFQVAIFALVAAFVLILCIFLILRLLGVRKFCKPSEGSLITVTTSGKDTYVKAPHKEKYVCSECHKMRNNAIHQFTSNGAMSQKVESVVLLNPTRAKRSRLTGGSEMCLLPNSSVSSAEDDFTKMKHVTMGGSLKDLRDLNANNMNTLVVQM